MWSEDPERLEDLSRTPSRLIRTSERDVQRAPGGTLLHQDKTLFYH